METFAVRNGCSSSNFNHNYPEHLITVASCNLSQWALDFEGNYERIARSIRNSKQNGARLRVGSELELSGYSCEDHFLEIDTYTHCWEMIHKLLNSDLTENIICVIGMPVIHKSAAYNCNILLLNRKILLIRPKMILANQEGYKETRYFSSWKKGKNLETFVLPSYIADLTGQTCVKIGNGILNCNGITIGIEICEELWAPNSAHIDLSLEGADIICNTSASYFQINKIRQRMELIESASRKIGALYIYANQQGCDGGRFYFDGGGAIYLNGALLAQSPQFSMNELEIIFAIIDYEDILSVRIGQPSRTQQIAETVTNFQYINTEFSLMCTENLRRPSKPIHLKTYQRMEEINLSITSWLWDYLRRSSASGFFVPLSGGADSSTVATLVASMCQRLFYEVQQKNERIINDLEIILKIKKESFPSTVETLCHQFLYTCYMGTINSSPITASLSYELSQQIGTNHTSIFIDKIIQAFQYIFTSTTGRVPKFQQYGGSLTEDLALQNIQARIRMVFSYFLASLLPWVNGRLGWLLVLGTGNADESLRGYFTKYDCSSGDINPIGSLSKSDINSFLCWASENLGYSKLKEIQEQIPTAELRPLNQDNNTQKHSQNDEEDMGLTYNELGLFGYLRKIKRFGPVSMYHYLLKEWNFLSSQEVAKRVTGFFSFYSKNRHKMTTITPSCHVDQCSPDDNRYDLRPFLYPSSFHWQFNRIKEHSLHLMINSNHH